MRLVDVPPKLYESSMIALWQSEINQNQKKKRRKEYEDVSARARI